MSPLTTPRHPLLVARVALPPSPVPSPSPVFALGRLSVLLPPPLAPPLLLYSALLCCAVLRATFLPSPLFHLCFASYVCAQSSCACAYVGAGVTAFRLFSALCSTQVACMRGTWGCARVHAWHLGCA